uniref:Uncharacterized protein n=1 Tax=Timema poppense TaxID=170557 RepID=A0A7R9DFW1_TIMPO|nr:unnamed protein product [Timema poppensis]
MRYAHNRLDCRLQRVCFDPGRLVAMAIGHITGPFNTTSPRFALRQTNLRLKSSPQPLDSRKSTKVLPSISNAMALNTRGILRRSSDVMTGFDLVSHPPTDNISSLTTLDVCSFQEQPFLSSTEQSNFTISSQLERTKNLVMRFTSFWNEFWKQRKSPRFSDHSNVPQVQVVYLQQITEGQVYLTGLGGGLLGAVQLRAQQQVVQLRRLRETEGRGEKTIGLLQTRLWLGVAHSCAFLLRTIRGGVWRLLTKHSYNQVLNSSVDGRPRWASYQVTRSAVGKDTRDIITARGQRHQDTPDEGEHRLVQLTPRSQVHALPILPRHVLLAVRSPDQDLNLYLPVLGSQAQHETRALANCATADELNNQAPGQ